MDGDKLRQVLGVWKRGFTVALLLPARHRPCCTASPCCLSLRPQRRRTLRGSCSPSNVDPRLTNTLSVRLSISRGLLGGGCERRGGWCQQSVVGEHDLETVSRGWAGLGWSQASRRPILPHSSRTNGSPLLLPQPAAHLVQAAKPRHEAFVDHVRRVGALLPRHLRRGRQAVAHKQSGVAHREHILGADDPAWKGRGRLQPGRQQSRLGVNAGQAAARLSARCHAVEHGDRHRTCMPPP